MQSSYCLFDCISDHFSFCIFTTNRHNHTIYVFFFCNLFCYLGQSPWFLRNILNWTTSCQKSTRTFLRSEWLEKKKLASYLCISNINNCFYWLWKTTWVESLEHKLMFHKPICMRFTTVKNTIKLWYRFMIYSWNIYWISTRHYARW